MVGGLGHGEAGAAQLPDALREPLRLAAAPISWGICEVPGWGAQLPPRRVLAEMRDLGIAATELGALGWLPTDPAELRPLLGEFGLSLVGGFVPLVLHDEAAHDEAIAAAHDAARLLAAGGAECFVTAVISSTRAWERPELSAAERSRLWRTLGEIDELVATHGLRQVVHPHVDTLIETADEVEELLANTGVQFTFDTGHLFLGGADCVELAARHGERIGLVHLKDVDLAAGEPLRRDEITLMSAVQRGLFPALGRGDVPLAATIEAIAAAGYRSWYVLEQDVALSGGLPAEGEGPRREVAESIHYLQSLDVLARR